VQKIKQFVSPNGGNKACRRLIRDSTFAFIQTVGSAASVHPLCRNCARAAPLVSVRRSRKHKFANIELKGRKQQDGASSTWQLSVALTSCLQQTDEPCSEFWHNKCAHKGTSSNIGNLLARNNKHQSCKQSLQTGFRQATPSFRWVFGDSIAFHVFLFAATPVSID